MQNESDSTAVAPFFVLTLCLMAVAQGPGLLATFGLLDGDPAAFMGFAALGLFSPAIAALIVLATEKGGPGVRSVLSGLRRRPPSALWFPLALFGLPALYAVAALLWSAFSPTQVPTLFLPENMAHIGGMLIIPFAEEIGWRGLALPRLQRRHSALRSSLILGAVWAVWHVAMFLAVSRSLPLLALSMANIVGLSIVFSWVFNRTNGSLWIAIGLHAALHLNNPYRSVPQAMLPMMLYTAVIFGVAGLCIALDRESWREMADCQAPMAT